MMAKYNGLMTPQDKNYVSREFNAPMPNAVFFVPGDAFHADNPQVASNGCVHLSTADSERFYDGLEVHDPVQILP